MKRSYNTVVGAFVLLVEIIFNSNISGWIGASAFVTPTNPLTISSQRVFGCSRGQQAFITKLFETSAVTSSTSTTTNEKGPIPVVLLAGFLGTGKTTTLKHLLENKEELKVGVIVNDVASVNIDAKLIANPSGNSIQNADATLIDLQNGCVCCSLSDELFFSIERLITGRNLDTIVVELSGVADPISIKNNWIMAPQFIKDMASLSRIVTVVDAASFGVDYMTWDTALDRPNWIGQAADGVDSSATRKVAELLAEQVEAADVIVVNKCDIADQEQIDVATTVARALNKEAQFELVEFGKISSSVILGTTNKIEINEPEDHSHSHEHSHSHDDEHSHDHEQQQQQSKSAQGTTCTDPDCTDHTHSHDHQTTSSASCTDTDCTDTTHSHSHSHNHMEGNNDIGLNNFVYTATRPFNPARLMKVLNKWPVPMKDTLDIEMLQDATKSGYEIQGIETSEISPFVGVIRSKGFCWFAPYKWDGANDDAWRHETAMYWSHAGRQFGISPAGNWWGTISQEKMQKYFINNLDEYERILRDDFVTTEFGDRRQEIVFIGINLNETKIRSTLTDCLLSDSEMDDYRTNVRRKFATISPSM